MSPNEPPDGIRPDVRDITSALPEWPLASEPPVALAPEPSPPHPGFRWSVLWCVGFLLVTQIPGAFIAAGIIILYAITHRAQAQALVSSEAILKSDVGIAALAAGFFVTEILVVGVSLLAIRLVVGRDWTRQLAVRQPSPAHVGLAVASLPGLIVLANAAYLLFKRTVPGMMAPVTALAREWPVTSALAGLTTVVLVFGLVLWLDWLKQRGVGGLSIVDVLLTGASLTGLVLLLIAGYLLVTFSGQDLMTQMTSIFNGWPWPLGVLIIGVGPGIGEELWCRGFLGRGLVAKHGVVLGVVFTSFFFGLIHLDPNQGLMAMLMGLYLHFTYLATRSLWVPILLHFLNNSVAVVGSRIAALEALDADPGKTPPHLLIAAAALLAAAAWALYTSRARVVPEEGGVLWRPTAPGVEYPPDGSGLTVVRPQPGLAAWGLTLLALAGFVGSCYAIMAVK
jgi:membrane protease YdiL (CAAX protease family)